VGILSQVPTTSTECHTDGPGAHNLAWAAAAAAAFVLLLTVSKRCFVEGFTLRNLPAAAGCCCACVCFCFCSSGRPTTPLSGPVSATDTLGPGANSFKLMSGVVSKRPGRVTTVPLLLLAVSVLLPHSKPLHWAVAASRDRVSCIERRSGQFHHMIAECEDLFRTHLKRGSRNDMVTCCCGVVVLLGQQQQQP
jgi:hypothetical protein